MRTALAYRLSVALATAASLCSPAGSAAQKLHFDQLTRDVIETRLNSVKFYNQEREVALKALFVTAGCKANLTEQPVKAGDPPNLIWLVPAKEAGPRLAAVPCSDPGTVFRL